MVLRTDGTQTDFVGRCGAVLKRLYSGDELPQRLRTSERAPASARVKLYASPEHSLLQLACRSGKSTSVDECMLPVVCALVSSACSRMLYVGASLGYSHILPYDNEIAWCLLHYATYIPTRNQRSGDELLQLHSTQLYSRVFSVMWAALLWR